MNQYTLYNSATGQILRNITCDDGMIGNMPLQQDEVLLSGFLDGKNNYIDSTGVLQPKGEQPSMHCYFDYSTKSWADCRTFEQIKEQHWGAIKSARASALSEPLSTPYGAFDADEKSQKSITDAALLLQASGPGATIDFTLADNSVTTLTAEKIVHVGLLLGQRTQLVHAKARDIRAQIDATTTKEELGAIVW